MNIRLPLLKKEWNKLKKKGLKEPDGYYALDAINNLYIVARDDTKIITLISKTSGRTFMIPKKYCILDKEMYEIKEASKMLPVSCSGSRTGVYDKEVAEMMKNFKW